ncbi:MAG: CARDB domain-containing protein, partial [Planctomycetota bacterium]
IQAGGKQVFLYMSIGETSDLRRWWDPAWTDDGTDLGARTAAMPDWISDTFSEASLGQARLVEFFEADGSVNQDWLTALKDEIDFLITDLGADGLFLDNVASYFEWFALPNDDRPASFFASAMSDLVKEISDYALSLNPNVQIIANGDPFLPFNTGDRPGKGQQFLDAISAMLQESVYYANDVRLPDTVNRDALFDVVADDGTPVLVLDYFDTADQAKLDDFTRLAVNDGFLPHADFTGGALDGLEQALNQPTDGADRLFYGPDGGTIEGGDGDDAAFGGSGDDTWRVDAPRSSLIAASGGAGPGETGTLTLDGALGTDALTDVENVQFSDQTVALADLLAPQGPDGVPVVVEVENIAGSQYLVRWRVDNLGDAPLAATNLLVQLLDDQGAAPQGRSTSVAVDAIPAGGSDSGSAGFTLANGVYTPRLTYDVGDQVAETDETNNVALGDPFGVGVPVSLPDYTIDVAAAAVNGAFNQISIDYTVDNLLAGDETREVDIRFTLERPGAVVELGTIQLDVEATSPAPQTVNFTIPDTLDNAD